MLKENISCFLPFSINHQLVTKVFRSKKKKYKNIRNVFKNISKLILENFVHQCIFGSRKWFFNSENKSQKSLIGIMIVSNCN